jgi:hypothetical protein
MRAVGLAANESDCPQSPWTGRVSHPECHFIRSSVQSYRSNRLNPQNNWTEPRGLVKGVLLDERTPTGKYYYLFDGLGSVTGFTDSPGHLVATYNSDSY